MNPIKIVIPARYDSSRLPGKPLLLLNDKPIFWHVVQRALDADVALEDITLATDNLIIEQEAKKLNIPVEMTSKSHVSGTDRVNEVATLLGWSDDTIVLNIQGDEPLVPSELIKSLISFTQMNEHFDITTIVTPIKSRSDFENPNVVKAILGEYNRALYFTRTSAPFNRDMPLDLSLAKRHIGIYAYKKSSLYKFCQYTEAKVEAYEHLEQLRALANGMSIGAIETSTPPPHGIDTMEDYQTIKSIMEK
jgi:3-deoxy-manno-octulosonate cytidylyltransferase (CMP-KDO synthetase)